jgi:hypothetical protein
MGANDTQNHKILRGRVENEVFAGRYGTRTATQHLVPILQVPFEPSQNQLYEKLQFRQIQGYLHPFSKKPSSS